jgi:hypothetical protein
MRTIDWGALIALALAVIGFAVYLGTLNTRVDDLDKKIDSSSASLDKKIDSSSANLDKKIDLITPNITKESEAAFKRVNDEADRVEKELSNALIVKSTLQVALDSVTCRGGLCCPSDGENHKIPPETLNGDDGKIMAAWWSPADDFAGLVKFRAIDVSVDAGHIQISCIGATTGNTRIRLFWIAK